MHSCLPPCSAALPHTSRPSSPKFCLWAWMWPLATRGAPAGTAPLLAEPPRPLLHAPPGRQVATLTYIAQTLLANNSERSAALGVPKCSCRQSYISLQGDGLLPALPLCPSAPQAQGQAHNPARRFCSDFLQHELVFQREIKPPRTHTELPSTHPEAHQCTSGSMKKHGGCRRAFLRQPPCSAELGLATPSSTSSEPSFIREKGTGTASTQRAAFCLPQVQQRNGLPCCRCSPDALVFGMCMHIHKLQFSSSPLTPPALSCVQCTLRL